MNKSDDAPKIEEASPQKPAPAASKSPWLTALMMLIVISLLLAGSYFLIQTALSRSFRSGKTASKEKKEKSAIKFNFAAPLDRAKEAVAKVKQAQPKPSELSDSPVKEEPVPAKVKTPGPDKKKSASMKSMFKRKSGSLGGKWPNLTLTGFGQAQGQSMAIINGQYVAVNGYIEGAQLIEVREQDVVLEFEGEVKTLTIQMKE